MTELLLVLLAYSQDTEVHVFKDLNFRCGSPRNCPRVRSPNKRLTLAFTDGDRTFMVIAMKTDADLGTWVEAVETEQRTVFQKRKELVREDRKLASEACVFQKLDVVVNGIAATVYETLLVHQGIAYRLVAFGTEDSKAFLDDCDAWLKSFEFLGDRKEWLDQLEGKPARSALAGGLVSFPLNRPRWKEVTFDQDTEYGYLDEATFQILSGGAWVYVRIRETRRDAAAELEDLKHRFLGRLKNSKSTPFQVGEVSCVDVSGEFQGMRRSIRAAAFVREDLFVEVSLESVPTRYEATRLDWERLVRELQLQSRSSPKEPPAFSSRVYGSERKLDPGLQAFLPGARRFLPAAGNRTLLQISPDGATAAILLENRLFLQDVATGRLRPLPDLWTTLPHIAWSKDGARIATASIEEGIVVVEISSLQATRIDVPAFRVSFGPAENELLACTRTTKLTSAIQSGKLEVVRLPRGERRVFLEFPLSRIDLATPSPDGRSVALVCNKDYPRTATEGGHLYVCNADGSGLSSSRAIRRTSRRSRGRRTERRSTSSVGGRPAKAGASAGAARRTSGGSCPRTDRRRTSRVPGTSSASGRRRRASCSRSATRGC